MSTYKDYVVEEALAAVERDEEARQKPSRRRSRSRRIDRHSLALRQRPPLPLCHCEPATGTVPSACPTTRT
jgi:hypothetical protein